MELNKAKIINILKSLSNSNFEKNKRLNNEIYKEKPLAYWNNTLYNKILQHHSISGRTIDLYEFYDFLHEKGTSEKIAEQH